jgi:transcription elongation GreA/GreB family factor
MIMQKTDYKKSDLRNFIMNLLAEKIEKIENFTQFTIEASRDIKKTPKYDSIREEAQEEIYQLQKQLSGLLTMQKEMAKVVNSEFKVIQLGSLVHTNKARFYISVSLGEFFFEGERFYAISVESPMAQKMVGMQAGDEFILNKIHQKIEEVL